MQRNIVAERILGLPKAALMDFRVGDDQRELAEGIRAMLAGRLPLERAAREGAERGLEAEDWAALGETGVFSLTLPEPGGHRPGPGRCQRRLRGARAGARAGSAGGHVPRRRRRR